MDSIEGFIWIKQREAKNGCYFGERWKTWCQHYWEGTDLEARDHKSSFGHVKI